MLSPSIPNVAWVRHGGRKRSVDRRSDQANETEKAVRRRRLLRRKEGLTANREEASGGSQSEEGRYAFWDPEKGERDPISLICSGIASEPFSP
jgi:ribosome assembly protein YihI (activator of Der GTPase)